MQRAVCSDSSGDHVTIEVFQNRTIMRTARHYIAREVYQSSAVVLIALVGLFTFFALIDGLDKVGDRVTLMNLLYLQALDLPNYLYELLPIGLLIGAVLALAGLAQRNELTILRASGVSGLRLLGSLWLITVPLVLGAFILSEYITPAADLRGSEVRLALFGHAGGGRLSSGYWIKEGGTDGDTRIINIQKLTGRGQVKGVTLYEFDANDALKTFTEADSGHFENGQLRLQDLTVIHIAAHPEKALADVDARIDTEPDPKAQTPPPPPSVGHVTHLKTRSIATALTPERLIARILTPDRMAISDLLDYIQYLQKNHLQTERQQVALWRKIAYPFTLLVMVTIAAPVGFMQTRRGGVGPKVFLGIILGVGFFMLNQLALNAGMLGRWPPWATATVPDLIGLSFALFVLFAMEHRHSVSLWLRERRLQRKPAS